MLSRSLAILAAVSAAAASHAAMLWDQGMSTGGFGGSWVNQTASQNFADAATFGTAVTVTQYVYYTNFDPTSFGTMHVKVWTDSAGVPGSEITSQDVSVASFGVEGVFSGNTVYHVELNLSPINLAAGTYQFGASGNGFEAAQVSLISPAPWDGQMAQFNASTYSFQATVGDQAFQLIGTPAPEPGTLVVLGGLTALVARKRRRN